MAARFGPKCINLLIIYRLIARRLENLFLFWFMASIYIRLRITYIRWGSYIPQTCGGAEPRWVGTSLPSIRSAYRSHSPWLWLVIGTISWLNNLYSSHSDWASCFVNWLIVCYCCLCPLYAIRRSDKGLGCDCNWTFFFPICPHSNQRGSSNTSCENHIRKIPPILNNRISIIEI